MPTSLFFSGPPYWAQLIAQAWPRGRSIVCNETGSPLSEKRKRRSQKSRGKRPKTAEKKKKEKPEKNKGSFVYICCFPSPKLYVEGSSKKKEFLGMVNRMIYASDCYCFELELYIIYIIIILSSSIDNVLSYVWA